MKLIHMRLADIGVDDVYALAYPRRPERYAGAEEKFPGLPLLVVDGRGRAVCGHDYLLLLRQRGETAARVMSVDLAPAEALLLNYNLTNCLFGLNLFEKLWFVRKVSPLLAAEEIQRRADLGFALSQPLLQALDILLADPFRASLASGRLGLKAALALAGMAAADRLALLGVFGSCGFSESQQRLVLQLLEEVAFREKKTLAAVLAAMDPGLLAGEMPQKKFMAALHELRYPAWALKEKEWSAWEKKAAAGVALSVNHAPFFARDEVQVVVTVKNRDQAEKLMAGLKKSLETLTSGRF